MRKAVKIMKLRMAEEGIKYLESGRMTITSFYSSTTNLAMSWPLVSSQTKQNMAFP